MKVLFIYPEHYLNIGIPGGISTLSAVLKRHGHQVAVFDTTFLKVAPAADARELHKKLHGGVGEKEADKVQAGHFKRTAYTIEDLVKDDPVLNRDEEFQKKIDSFSPDLIALSTMTSTFDVCMDMLRSVRHNAKVIVGGIHPTIAPEDCMAQKEIDIACYVEADEVLVELCDLMQAGRDHTNVKGMIFRMPDGSVKRTSTAPRVQLDGLPCPDWGLFDPRHLYRPFDGQIYQGSFYTQSRGCPQQCTYCVDPTVSQLTGGAKGYFRMQSVATTLAHLTELKAKHNVGWIKFADDSFLLQPVEHMQELGRGLRQLGIQFGCSVMPNTITEEKVRIAREMGCVAMTVGVESGNPDIRKLMKRTYENDKLVERLHWVIDAGIRLATFNIIGFPTETRANVFETIELNRRIGTDACNIYILFPYPGTPIQIEHKIPVRGKDGRIMPVSCAKDLGLSQMSPDELEGLQATFNFYLHLPKELWPIIALAEAPTPEAKSIRSILKSFVVTFLSKDPILQVPLSEVLSPERLERLVHRDLIVPRILAGLYELPLANDQVAAVTEALFRYDPSRMTHDKAGILSGRPS